MKLLALDFGTKRIGVATCDELGWTVRPLTTIQRKGGRRDLEAVVRLVREQQAEGLVMGLPMNMDGSEGRMARLARRCADDLVPHLPGVTIQMWDERLTSWEAEEELKARGIKAHKRRAQIDQTAAAIILESYLRSDRKESGD